jgi:Pyruvate/2-oxoacid:ferredoxin oxidoreductase delta subunit
MNIELRYFTGTGNSLKVLNTCKELFVEKGNKTNISAIRIGETIPEADIVGFCFPVYAFGIPRVCRKYLQSLKKFKPQQKTFVLITAGDADESGFSVNECKRILGKKNCNLIYSAVVQMPINWTTSMNPPSKEEYIPIIEKGTEQTRLIANDILNGVEKHHKLNIPKRYGRLKFYREYLLFKYLGIYNMWRLYQVYDSCNGCGLCTMVCPVQSIQLVNNRPKWSSSCEQCMRCVNFCPRKAIYQSYGGDTRLRNRYLEPGFKPLEEAHI